MKKLSLILIALLALNAQAADLNQEMDALGANKELMRKAKAIDPDNQMRVVQNREVDRHMRLELGVNIGMNATGGDPYVNTTALGGQLDFHFTPHWSVGVRYDHYSNSYNSEGQQVYNDAQNRIAAGEQGVRLPSTSWATDSWIGLVDWYPIYGKLNLFDAAVAHFDIYTVGGAGVINLATGSTPVYTAGGGVGFWWTQHLTSRFEARWQGYQDKVWDGVQLDSRNENELVLTASIGFLL